ncbi:MAG: nucleotidyl transferase AbiEii/AbiGii toxin family protein [Saprospiraceae bacterium]|nr:nucleotidyl transferase AbiEii/AbiGii toxin family protein [Saprospiraceae bacterium]
MNTDNIKIWNVLTDIEKRDIYYEVSAQINLPPSTVEKDWWVVRTLELFFQSTIAPSTVFKGGTSLSKAWNLIDRFSEDIDLALDRRILGFTREDKDMSSSQVSKLRRKSFKYISEEFYPEIIRRFQEAGLVDVTLKLGELRSTDDDPIIIEVYYPSVTERIEYIQPRVLIEIGSRSLIEPHTDRAFKSLVGEQFAGRAFADTDITIPTVIPERTFLEKIFLIHEIFQLEPGRKRIERQSRHLYDLEKLMDTSFGQAALQDKELYDTIVLHREKVTPERGVDYTNHQPEKINLIPPAEVIGEWEKDYKTMQESMFYKSSLPFDELMDRIRELNARINSISSKNQ